MPFLNIQYSAYNTSTHHALLSDGHYAMLRLLPLPKLPLLLLLAFFNWPIFSEITPGFP